MKHTAFNQIIVFFIGIAFLIGCSLSSVGVVDVSSTATTATSTSQPLKTFTPADTIKTPQAQASVQPLSSPTIQVIEPIEKERLQITYINIIHNDSVKIYGIDVICVGEEELCLSDPDLLFESPPFSYKTKDQPSGIIYEYDWSPEGDRLALSANLDIYIIDMNTQEWENVTRSTDVNDFSPHWSPGGDFIFYKSCPVMDGMMLTCQLMRYDIDEQVMSPWLTGIGYSIEDFSMDKELQIVFSTTINGVRDIFQSNLYGFRVNPLTNTESFEETSPAFSPDGKYVAFYREEFPEILDSFKSQSGLILLDIESGKEVNLVEYDLGEAYAPEFSFDGKQITYTLYKGNSKTDIYILFLDNNVIQRITFDNNSVYSAWRRYVE
jgi:WD40 repeat protein